MTTGPIVLVIQHIISSEIKDAARQMKITLDAVAELGYKTLVGYPNSDAGSREIIGVIQEYTRGLPFVKVYRSLVRLEFVNVLQTVDALVGNSSLGILEAPFLKLPAINVGNRQKKRQHSENVIFVPHDKSAIKEAIHRTLFDEKFQRRLADCSNPSGNGHAGEKLSQVLAEVKLDEQLVVKDWTY